MFQSILHQYIFFATNNINFITLNLKRLKLCSEDKTFCMNRFLSHLIRGNFLCILMQYEMELMYTFGTIALKFIFIKRIFFYELIMMWKPGTGSHFLITANSL